MGMTREEAISKLHELIECTIDRGMIDDICYEIIEFLEAQEPRVMDDAKLLEYDGAVWIENKRDTGTVLSICKSADDRQFRFFSKNEWENVAYLRKNYGETWRCWSSRPSPEQMRDTPWEGENDA